MSIGVYIRVSSSSQKHDSQRAEIQKWIESNGIDSGQVAWYADKESGRTLRRPEFERLQGDIFSGTVKTVVIWKLDRLSRSLKDGIAVLSDWCERGVRVVSVTQQIDLSGSVGRMIAAVMLGLGEIEWEHRLERQAAGIEVAKRNGVYRGRKRGTTKAKPKRAKELHAQGLKPSEIATVMRLSPRTVFRYLEG